MSKIYDKIFSARYAMSLITTASSSALVGLVFYLCYKQGKLDVGIAVVMAYIAIWKEIVMAYFDRTDRKGEAPSA